MNTIMDQETGLYQNITPSGGKSIFVRHTLYNVNAKV